MASKIADGWYEVHWPHGEGTDVAQVYSCYDGQHVQLSKFNARKLTDCLEAGYTFVPLVPAPAAVTIPSEVREAAMRASAWLVDMLNDYRGDGMDDLRADVITWRQWLDSLPADDA